MCPFFDTRFLTEELGETCRYVFFVYVDSGSKVLELEVFRAFILIAATVLEKKSSVESRQNLR